MGIVEMVRAALTKSDDRDRALEEARLMADNLAEDLRLAREEARLQAEALAQRAEEAEQALEAIRLLVGPHIDQVRAVAADLAAAEEGGGAGLVGSVLGEGQAE